MEAQLRSRANDVAHLLGILQAGHLHQDAIRAETLQRRLADAKTVDAAADDFEALIDRGAATRNRSGFRGAQFNGAVRPPRDVEITLCVGKRRQRDVRRQPSQRAFRVGALGRVVQPDHNGRSRVGNRPADACIAQRILGAIRECTQLIARQRGGVDFDHDLRTAAQVEAERDLLFGQPAGQSGQLLTRQKIGGSDDKAKQNDERIAQELPSGRDHDEHQNRVAKPRAMPPAVRPVCASGAKAPS